MKAGFILFFIVLVFQLLPVIGKQDPIILGSDNVDEELFIPCNIKIGPDKSIYAFDKKAQCIKVYSSETGKFLRKFGREGEAPGEFLRFGSFNFTLDNMIFFVEAQNGHPWITFMDLSGKYKKLLNIDRKNNYGFYYASMLSDQRIIAEYFRYGILEKKASFYVESFKTCIVIIDKNGQLSQPIIEKTIPFSISNTPNSTSKGIPFVADISWDVSGDNRILTCIKNLNILELYDLKGKLIGKIKTPLPEAPKVTSKDIDKWKEEIKAKIVKDIGNEAFNNKFSMIMRYDGFLYDRKPIIDSIAVTPSNNILICEEKPEEVKESKYHLINFKGESLIKITSRAYNITISKDFIVYVIDDEDENPFTYCMKRKGSEKDDLSRINNK